MRQSRNIFAWKRKNARNLKKRSAEDLSTKPNSKDSDLNGKPPSRRDSDSNKKNMKDSKLKLDALRKRSVTGRSRKPKPSVSVLPTKPSKNEPVSRKRSAGDSNLMPR